MKSSNFISHIALLTSCIVPNTTSGPITNFSKEERLIQLVKNINYLISIKKFRQIYIVDPYLQNKNRIRKFKSSLYKNGLKDNYELRYIIFNPSKNINKEINLKGKGYSELKMIIESNKNIKLKNKNSIIHKISGRYKILNIERIIRKSEIIMNRNYLFFVPYSNFLSKCITVMISYKSEVNNILFENCSCDIDDKKYRYLEHSIFKNIVKKNYVYRNRSIPKYGFNMIGGSNQGRYNRYKQFMTNLIYRCI